MALANRNPFAGVYSGGTTVVSSEPFLNHFLQLQAQKNARDQAMDNYYRDQMNSITPTGVRSQDLGNGNGDGGFLDEFNKFKNIGLAKKDLLLNPQKDNYQTVKDFNTQKNKLLGMIAASKQAASNDKQYYTYLQNGNPTSRDYEIINDNSKPIWDKTRVGYDPMQLSFTRAPLDTNKWLSDISANHKRGTQLAAQDIIDDKNGLRTTSTHDVYSPDDLKAISDSIPASMTGNDRTTLQKIDAFDHILHSGMLPDIQKAYSSVYPNGGLVDSPVKAAQGYAIMNLGQPTNVTSKTVPYESPAAKLARSQQEATFKSNLERGNMRYKDWLDNGGTNVLNDRVNGLINSAKLHPIPVAPGGTTPGYTSYDLPKDPDIEKAVVGTLKKGDAKPNAYRYIEKDGEPGIQAIYYSRTVSPDGKTYTGIERQNGKPVIDDSKSKFIPFEEFRTELGKTMFTGKQLARNLQQPYAPPTIKNGTVSPKQTKLNKGALDNIGQ